VRPYQRLGSVEDGGDIAVGYRPPPVDPIGGSAVPGYCAFAGYRAFADYLIARRRWLLSRGSTFVNASSL
jgi:hypothetical protein